MNRDMKCRSIYMMLALVEKDVGCLMFDGTEHYNSMNSPEHGL